MEGLFALEGEEVCDLCVYRDMGRRVQSVSRMIVVPIVLLMASYVSPCYRRYRYEHTTSGQDTRP